jgi:outer membrane protein assembly factor BamB
VFDGKTVFGGCDALLHLLSIADGSKIKEVDAGAYIAASVAIDDNKAYVGHYENAFLCIDLEKSTNLWTYRDRNFPYFSSPARTKDRVVFGGRDKRLHCLNRADGKVAWTFPTRGKVDSSPAIAGDKVVVGSDDGRLYMVNLTNGKELWSYEIGPPVASSPAVVDGKVIVGADDGNVYAFVSDVKGGK